MISPINYSVKNNLEPVKIPTFKGKSCATVTTAKRIKEANHEANVVSFKQQTKEVAQATKNGVLKTYEVAKEGGKKCYDFTTPFFKSLFGDVAGIAKEKGTKALTGIDGISNIVS